MRFLATVLVASAVLHLYLWHRLVHATSRRGGPWWWLGTVTAAILAVGLATALIVRGEHMAVAVTAYPWLALGFYLAVALLLLEPVRLVIRWWSGRRRAPTAGDATGTTDMERRLFLARSVAVVAGAAAVGVTGYGVYEAFGSPRLVRVQLPLARLGRALDGYRIALVSDIHCGPLLGAAHVRRLVTTINAVGVDLVAITGDLADGTVAELGRAAEPLRELRPRDGAFFVTGNHEYYAEDVPAWLEALRGWGVRPLANERVEMSRGGAALDLAGVNDPTGEGYGDPPDFARAVGDRDPSRPVVLLAHQPVHVAEARRHGVDLQLSGHTHGGQMCPFNLAVGLQQPVVAGHGRFGQTQLYVTRGAGFWGPPVRVGAEPEIVLIELRAP